MKNNAIKALLRMKSALCLSLLLVAFQAQSDGWTKAEEKRASRFSVLLLDDVNDSSNKYLHNKAAIALGEQLFRDERLSSNGQLACNSCHIKKHNFTDNKTLAFGLRKGFRNTPTLFNVAHHEWFFADGAKDSLWAQVLSSLENPAEQNFSRMEVLHLISTDENYRSQYSLLFDEALPDKNVLLDLPDKAGPNAQLRYLINWKRLSKPQRVMTNRVFTNIGKSLAAFVATITPTATRFDDFLAEYKRDKKSTKLNDSEQRGFRLFMSGKAGCAKCHSGPLFTNKSFHHIATGIPGKDNGRSEVIETVIRDEFNCLSQYSDADPKTCLELIYVNRNKHHLRGAFKTSTLRGIAKTAPYMHDGRFNTLEEVLEHYVTVSDVLKGQTDLSLIKLTVTEKMDIINFLKTL